jgi:hypothetical protein
MGINSTHTSYAFGQLGSAHCKTASSVFPPRGMVICAVQFLAANTPTIMRTETSSALAQDHFACLSTEHAAHNNGDTQQALTDAALNTVHTLSAANANIQVGMQVISDTEYTGVDKTNDKPAVVVTKVNGTAIEFNRPITAAGTTLTFSKETGDGGEDASGITYPTGIIIYGRWTEVRPSADADGGIICYFGY